jgi:hypothetical protein
VAADYDLGTAHGKVIIDYDGDREIKRAEKDIDRLKLKAKESEKDFSRLKNVLGGLGKGLALTGVITSLTTGAAQAAAFGVNLLGTIPALESIISLSAAIPGLIVGAAASVGVFKAAFAGLDKAVQAAFDTEHPEKFDKAIKDMSPNAQAFAKAIRDNVPELRKFQQGLQDAFFSNNLQQFFPDLIDILGELSPELRTLAADYGKVAVQVGKFATSNESVKFIRDSVVAFDNAIKDVAPSLDLVLGGIRDVGTVGLDLIPRLSESVGIVATQFGDWLSAVASDGRLQAWIDQALATLKILASIVGSVFSVFQNLFSIAQSAGGGLLGTLDQLAGALNAFLKSGEGRAAVTELFQGILAVAKQLAPIFTTLVGVLARALGPALEIIATQLGPVLLQVIQALAPAVGPLVLAMAQLAAAVAPLLPPIAKLVALFAGSLATTIQGLASAIGPLAAAFGDTLSQALERLTPLLGQAAEQVLPLAAALGEKLLTAIAPLLPQIVQLADAFVTSLAPALPAILQSFTNMIPVLVQLAGLLAEGLGQSIQTLIPLLPALISGLTLMAQALLGIMTFGVRVQAWLLTFAKFMSGLPAQIGAGIGALAALIGGALKTAYNFVISVGGQILSWFSTLPGKVISFLSSLPGRLSSLIGDAIHRAAFAFGQGIGILISQATAAPGQIYNGFRSLISLLGSLASQAWSAVRSRFAAGVNNATGTARTLVGRVTGAIRALPGQLSSLASQAWARLRSAFSSGINSAVSLARSLPGRIRGALGNLGSLLVSAGHDVVMGLVRGISGAIGSAVSAAADVGRSVISGIKSTLRISSPSKVMIQLGRFVTQGLVQGLTGTANQVRAASNKVADAVLSAFSADKITRGQKNSVLRILEANNGRLVNLANRSVTVAAKLKTAQASLNSVVSSYNDAYNNAYKQTQQGFNIVGNNQYFLGLDEAKSRLIDTVKTAKQFAADIATLTRRGLHKDLLAQLVGAGPEEAGSMARSLANASTATLKQFNSLQSQLNNASQKVGKSTADALYGAGLRAAQGLVAGLKAQQAAIERQMLAIALSMKSAIKRALKIKSPSRVMQGLGDDTAEGLIVGLLNRLGDVRNAAGQLANSVIAPTVGLDTARIAATTTLPNALTAADQNRSSADLLQALSGTRTYQLMLDGKVMSTFVVDAITGNPVVVNKASKEGSRVQAWSGSGRKSNGA